MARKQAGPRPLYLTMEEREIVETALHAVSRDWKPRQRDQAERIAASVARPPRKGHHLVKCQGEAHGNPHIDNCGDCAPRWGWIEVPDAPAAPGPGIRIFRLP